MESVRDVISALSMKGLSDYVGSVTNWGEKSQELVDLVLNRYADLCAQQSKIIESSFGNASFWERVLGPFNWMENDDFSDEEPPVMPPSFATNDVQRTPSPIPGPSHASPDLMIIEPDEEQIGGAVLDDHIEVRPVNDIYVKRFRTSAKGYDVSFRNLDTVDDVHDLVSRTVDHALKKATENASDDSLVGMQINAPAMTKPVLIPFRKKSEINAEDIMHLLDDVMQSNQNVDLDESLSIRATTVQPPVAGGPKKITRRPQMNWREHIAKLSHGHGGCVIKIENDDMLCVSRAICLGIARFEKDENDEKKRYYKQLLEGERKGGRAQFRAAVELAARAGIDTTRMCGPAEFAMLQEAIDDHYRLVIWDLDLYMANVFVGPEDRERTIHLLLDGEHCALVTSMPRVLVSNYFCNHCLVGYNTRGQHSCTGQCPSCRESPPCDFERIIWCNDCCRRFVSAKCLENHKKNFTMNRNKRRHRKPLCETLRMCEQCGHRKDPNHLCGQTTCPLCGALKQKGKQHECFVPTYKSRKTTDSYIFFDLEARTDHVVTETELGVVTEHQINCAVALKVCSKCVEDPENDCEKCGTSAEKLKIFFGENTMTDLCEYLFCEDNEKSCIMAHNFKSYDGQFILRYIEENSAKKPKLTVRGFNTEANYNASLPQLPDLKYYFPEQRSTKARMELEKWHADECALMLAEERRWVFKDELIRYCKADVMLLARSAMKFLGNMKELTGINCFNESMTIAGACMLHFRKNHMTPKTIALIPEGGYRRSDKQSVLGIKYLKWLSHSRNLSAQRQYIRHAQNGGEYRIEGYKVDGILCSLDDDQPDLHTVYEVYGCAWHGCPKCFKNREQLGPNGIQMEALYESTMLRQRIIERAGYTVEVHWEHQILTELKNNAEMKTFFDSCTNVIPPLDPRQSFYGGRVAALQLNYECKDNEKIHYYDVCSLYPWVNRYGLYPVGHAKVLTEDFALIDKDHKPYDGLVLAKVLPPRKLDHPVLPYRRSDHKMLFQLCKTSADEDSKVPCTHSDEERCFTGCFVTLEFYVALDEGYEVISVHEVYHFDKLAQYDGEDPKTSLFATYVSFAIKLKVEASGWPPGCETDEQKDKYVKDYMENENIELDPMKVEHNPSLRSLGKLVANSFWGKFGQRSDTSSVEYFTEPAKYFELVFDPTVEVRGIRICNENTIAVTYKKATDFVESPNFVNSVIAAFTTAQARLKLLSFLKKLGKRVYYYDTDSIIFKSSGVEGEYMPPVGCYLGDLTDELAEYGDGSYCTHLIAAGPKVYAMKIFSTKKNDYVYTLKCRGFTIDSETSKKLNFESLKQLVDRFIQTGDSGEVTSKRKQIAKQSDRAVISRVQKKSYRVVCNKLRVLSDGSTEPYGY